MQADANVNFGLTSTASARLDRVVYRDLPNAGDFMKQNDTMTTVVGLIASEEVVDLGSWDVTEANKGLTPTLRF